MLGVMLRFSQFFSIFAVVCLFCFSIYCIYFTASVWLNLCERKKKTGVSSQVKWNCAFDDLKRIKYFNLFILRSPDFSPVSSPPSARMISGVQACAASFLKRMNSGVQLCAAPILKRMNSGVQLCAAVLVCCRQFQYMFAVQCASHRLSVLPFHMG